MADPPPPPPDDPNGLNLTESCCAQTRKETIAQIREQVIRQIHALQAGFDKTKNGLRRDLAEARSKLDKLETERAKPADADDAIAARLAAKDAELDRLRRELDG